MAKKKNSGDKVKELFKDGTWAEDKELTGYAREIFDNLQEMPIDDRIKTILDVLAHDSDLFLGVNGRIVYEMGHALRKVIKDSGCDKGMDKNQAYMITCATYGKKMFDYGDKAMKEHFLDEYESFEKELKKKSE